MSDFSRNAGTPSEHVWQFLGDGVGAEESRRGDAEPSHRERIGEWLLVVVVHLLPGHPVFHAEVKLSLRFVALPCVNLQVKCAQYWPQREERDTVFEDTNFKLTFVSEDVKSYYTVRQLELENLTVSV